MAAPLNFMKEVENITECPICIETLESPKVLPCQHTFCTKCLVEYGNGKQDGESLPCPVCRSEFTIPVGGITKLKDNFFIQKLIEIQKSGMIEDPGGAICDVCSAVKQVREVARMICVECQENMCEECANIHRIMKISKSHEICPIGARPEIERASRMKRNYCEEHPGSKVKVYCRNCEVVACLTCSACKHNKHELVEISKIGEELKSGMRRDCDDVASLIADVDEQQRFMENQFDSFTSNIVTVEKSIRERGEEIKQLIDRHVDKLLEKTFSLKSKILKEIEKTRSSLRTKKSALETFKKYCQETIDMAHPVVMARVAKDLHLKADELKKQPATVTWKHAEIVFNESDVTRRWRANNIVGSLVVSLPLKVQGMAILRNRLYIAQYGSSSIALYNTETYARERSVQIAGLYNPYDLVAGQDSVYVSDANRSLIHRLRVPEETTMSWLVEECDAKPMNLSVTSKGHILATVVDPWLRLSSGIDGNDVIVATPKPPKILEFTASGGFVRQIAVDKSLFSLQHAVVPRGNAADQVILCHESNVFHRVCLVCHKGKLVKSYGGSAGSGAGQMKFPCRLAVGENGSVLVADRENNRLVMLNSNLEFVKEFSHQSTGLIHPFRVALQDNPNRVYVAEYRRERMLIIETESV